MHMPRAETIVQLSTELREQLDLEAARRGTSRSALIREAIEAYLAETSSAAIARRIVEGYTRVPQAAPDEWGDLAAQSDRASVETLQRLDAEERAAGLPPW